MQRSAGVIAVALALILVAPATGQEISFPPRISVDATLGVAASRWERDYRDDSLQISLDLLVTLRPRPAGWIAGAAVSANGAGRATTDICAVEPNGGCTPTFPSTLIFTGLAGWENPAGTLRLMAGAGYVHPGRDHDGTIALQARGHVAGIARVGPVSNLSGQTGEVT